MNLDHTETFSRVDAAIAAIRAGKMVILVDDEDRENEGDLTMAADLVTPDAINFMATHGRGLICVTLTEEQVARLELPMMQPAGRAGPPLGTAFTVSVEARRGVTTGISSADRAQTIKVCADPQSLVEDLVTPGHVFPLRARDGGVLVRTGQTEGSVDLARLAGLTPAGVICEIMNDDGTMARMPDLEKFGQRHGLLIVSVADLIQYRLRMDRLVRRVHEGAFILAETGTEWRVVVYEEAMEKREIVALVKGDVSPSEDVLVRMHDGGLFSDVFAERRTLLAASLRAIEAAGRGVVVYFPPRTSVAESLEVKSGPSAKQKPVLQEYGLGAQILSNLGVRRLRLLSNTPLKLGGLAGFGLEIIETVSVVC